MNRFYLTGRRVFFLLSFLFIIGENCFAVGGEDCANAALISVASSLANCSYTTVNSGTTQNGPNAQCSDATGNVANDDAWLKFVAPATSNKLVITTTAGTVNDWVMEVWNGCVGTGSVLKCADDVNAAMPQITLCQNEFVAGQTYYIRYWTYSSSLTGTMNICIYQDIPCIIPPSNDDCINAKRLTVSPPSGCPAGSQSFTTVDATATSASASCYSGSKKDVFFVFNTGSLADIYLNISPGTATGLMAQVLFECGGVEITNDCFASANGTYLLTGLNPQADYIIRVWATTTQGTFNICLSDVCSNPTAIISGNPIVCPGQSAALSVTFTGVPPYSFTYSNGVSNTGVATSNNPYSLVVTPSVATTYTLVNMSDVSCSGTVSGSGTVTFTNPQPVTMQPFSPVCINAGLQTLSGGAPGGGVYSGTGVSNGKFDPAVGSQTLTYTVTYAPGCTRSNSQVFSVRAQPTAILSGTQNICSGNSADLTVNFTGTPPFLLTYSNGTTSFPVSTSSNPYTLTVTPVSATTYSLVSIVDATCSGHVSGSATVTVSNPTTVTLASFTPVCSNAGLQTLSGGSPAGGTYSGTGVSAGKFDPSVGTQTITYTIAGSCGGNASKVFTVNSAPSASLSGTQSICSGSSANLLITFTGTGPYSFIYNNGTVNTPVNNTSSNPYTIVVSPTSTATYTLVSMSNATCSGNTSGNAVVTVINPATVTLASFAPVCSNAGLQTLTGGSPAGGNYSGTGVSAGKFDPTVGTQTITYTIVYAAGCSRSDSKVLTVNNCNVCANPAIANAGADKVSCNGGSVVLSGSISGSASSSTWSGGSGTFTPNNTTPGATYLATAGEISSGQVRLILTTNDPDGAGVCIAGKDTMFINYKSTPVTPVVSGQAIVCTNQNNISYSIPVQSNVTYLWTVPTGVNITAGQGTNSITANFTGTAVSGSICVTVSNECGNKQGCKSITVRTAVPTISAGITGGLTNICRGQSSKYYIPKSATADSYLWTPPTGATINGSSSPFSTVDTFAIVTYGNTFTGDTLRVRAVNCKGNGAEKKSRINQRTTVPSTPGTITGLNTICLVNTQKYTIVSIVGVTGYTWRTTIAGALINGQASPYTTTDTSVTITFPSFTSGTLYVKANNGCGSSAEKSLAITSPALPATPGAITGLTNVCRGESLKYSIKKVKNATSYIWTPPVGTTINGSSSAFTTPDTSVIVVFGATFAGDTIRVIAGNCKGNSAQKKIRINRRTTVPSVPASITGLSVLCNSGVQNYMIRTASGAITYTWRCSVAGSLINGLPSPQTLADTTVTISVPAFTTGSIFVKANNGCGSSTERALAIRNTPAAAASISGPASVCTNQTNVVYSITALTGATTYTWTVPAAITILSGQGTTSATVKFNTSTGSKNIKITGNNTCGTGAAKNLAVTVATCPRFGDSSTASDNFYNLDAYPNPTRDKLKVEFTSDKEARFNFSVIDLSGRVLKNTSMSAVEGTNYQELDMTGLAEGMYILNVEGPQGSRQLRIIVE